jgi:hypothetical protein
MSWSFKKPFQKINHITTIMQVFVFAGIAHAGYGRAFFDLALNLGNEAITFGAFDCHTPSLLASAVTRLSYSVDVVAVAEM